MNESQLRQIVERLKIDSCLTVSELRIMNGPRFDDSELRQP